MRCYGDNSDAASIKGRLQTFKIGQSRLLSVRSWHSYLTIGISVVLHNHIDNYIALGEAYQKVEETFTTEEIREKS